MEAIDKIIQWDKDFAEMCKLVEQQGEANHNIVRSFEQLNKLVFIDADVVYKVYGIHRWDSQCGLKEIFELFNLSHLLLDEKIIYKGSLFVITTQKRIEVLHKSNHVILDIDEIPSLSFAEKAPLNSFDYEYFQQLGKNDYLMLRDILIAFRVYDFSHNCGRDENNKLVCFDMEFFTQLTHQQFLELINKYDKLKNIQLPLTSSIWHLLRRS